MEIFDNNCFVCGTTAQAAKTDHDNRFDVCCSNCGRYQITNNVISNLTNARREYLKMLLTTTQSKVGYYDIYLNFEKELCHTWVDKI